MVFTPNDSKKSIKPRKKRKVAEELSGPGTWRGYRCKRDCSGHEAGYRWFNPRNGKLPKSRLGSSFYEGAMARKLGKGLPDQSSKKRKKKFITSKGLKNLAATAAILGLGMYSLKPTITELTMGTPPLPPPKVPHML